MALLDIRAIVVYMIESLNSNDLNQVVTIGLGIPYHKEMLFYLLNSNCLILQNSQQIEDL